MKRLLGLGFCLLLLPAFASAATHSRYRIDLRDGRHLFSVDPPVRRGTVVTFHESPGGALTGIPAEEILAIQSGSAVTEVKASRRAADVLLGGQATAIQTLAQPLQPGEIVVLGPTGSGSAQLQNAQANAMAPAGAGTYTPPGNGAYGGGYPFVPTAVGPNGQPLFNPQPGNTLNAQSGAPPTMGPDGFPVGSGNPPTIGPNGTPISSSDQPIIGANGTPVVPGTATAAQPVVGANGTPVMPGTAGAAQPVIGPNGTPVLAPSGSPGAAAPVIGPNGTPVLAPAGAPGSAPPNIGPNGTPAAPPPGAGPHK